MLFSLILRKTLSLARNLFELIKPKKVRIILADDAFMLFYFKFIWPKLPQTTSFFLFSISLLVGTCIVSVICAVKVNDKTWIEEALGK
jgi:hypothetical protein